MAHMDFNDGELEVGNNRMTLGFYPPCKSPHTHAEPQSEMATSGDTSLIELPNIVVDVLPDQPCQQFYGE